MSALHPNAQVTAGAVPTVTAATPARAAHRRRSGETVWDGTPHAAVQLAVAIAAAAFGWFAVQLTFHGFAWAALPVAVLATALLVGTFLPDVLAGRWDRARSTDGEL